MTSLATIRGLTATRGDLEDGESIEERVFGTVSAALEAAGVERDELDAVVIAADDLADGRSITTMLHATAAGAYLKDEIRTTNGSLTALSLGALRIQAGFSKTVLVAGWWLPTADEGEIVRASLDARGSRALVDPARLAPCPTVGACAACVLSAPNGHTGLTLRAFAFGQADYDGWLAGTDEPARLLGRIGADLRSRLGDEADVVSVAHSPVGSWGELTDAAAVPRIAHERVGEAWYGLADGLVLLADAAPGDGAGATLVATTGVPAFLQVEAAVVGAAA